MQASLKVLRRGFITLTVLTLLFVSTAAPSLAQELPPCNDRPTFRDPPWVDGRAYCPETVIQTTEGGLMPYAALATAPDGTLYATRPLMGQVLAIEDTDGDLLPDSSRVLIEGLTLPNGLAYHEGALYIAGGSDIYRWQDDELVTLVDDLPVSAGGWIGDLTLGPDERLYVSVGTNCDVCVPQDPAQGAVLSFALDGSDRALVANGLRQSGDLAFIHGDLWATDSAPDDADANAALDELNRVRWGANLGFPYCVGNEATPEAEDSDFDCSAAAGPAFSFPTGSHPRGLAAYESDALPTLTGSLLVVLSGSRFTPDLQGYALAVVRFDEAGEISESQVIIPERTLARNRVPLTVELMNYNGSGFWPNRPLDVTVSAQGYVYISVSGGEILALRPL